MLINAIRLIMMPLVMVSAWLSIERTANNPFSDSDYLLYYLLVPIVLNLTDSRVVFKFPVAIRNGTLSRDLLKPYPPLIVYAAESLTNNLVQLFYLAPFTLIASILLQNRLPAINTGLYQLMFFALAIVFGGLIRMFIAGAISLMGFWLEDITTLNLVLNGGVWALLGGMIIPVATFPDHLRTIAGYLPYRYMLSFPIEVLSGQLSQQQIIQGYITVAAWIIFFSIIMRILWKRGLKVYSAYGG